MTLCAPSRRMRGAPFGRRTETGTEETPSPNGNLTPMESRYPVPSPRSIRQYSVADQS